MIKKIKKAIILFVISSVSFSLLGLTVIKEKMQESKYVFSAQNAEEAGTRYDVYGGIMENLQQKHPDIKGWINVENTRISYPLLQTTDNDYYIRRAYDGTADKAGSIIVDYRLDENLNENRNLILYGHNMASGNMFAYLANPKNFTEAEIEIYSDGVLAIYKPYAAYIESGNKYIKTSFENEQQISDYINTGKSKTVVEFDTKIPEMPYLLTMVTCESSLGLAEKRIVIQAVRTSIFFP